MSKEEEVESSGLDVEQLELTLGMFEIQLDQKLKQLRESFNQQGFQMDLTKLYYDHINSTELKFKELMADLHTLLIKQEQSSTPNLRSTFFRIIENPLFALFKTSKFELFDLSLNGFDIEIEPLEALKEVHSRLILRIQECKALLATNFSMDMAQIEKKVFRNRESLLLYSLMHEIEYKIFTLYSYLRKGAQLLRKTFQSRLAVTEMFNAIEKDLVPLFVKQTYVRGLKEISTLNFEIFNIEPTYDYFFYYFSVPMTSQFLPVYLDINLVAERCHRSNNYNPFIQFFLKHHRALRDKLQSAKLTQEWVPYINSMMTGALRLLRSEVMLFEEFVQIIELLLQQSQRHPIVLETFLKFTPDKDIQNLRQIHNHYLEIVKAQPELVSTLRSIPFEKVRERLEMAQRKCLYELDFTKIPLTKVQQLNEIIGGMPNSYFEFIEGRLKQLNSTASISNKHKYIGSQFNIVEVGKLTEVMRDINNFMTLNEAYPKEYEALYEGKLNPRYFLDLLGILIQNENELKDKPELDTFIFNVFKLFQRVKPLKDGFSPFEQIKYYRSLSKAATMLSDPIKHKIFSDGMMEEVSKDKNSITIKDYISLVANLKSVQFDPVDVLIGTFLAELGIINQQVSKRRFHEMALQAAASEILTEDEASFIKQNFEIVNDELVAKDIGIFRISNQDQTTNPLNLDSRIDDVYLNLTVNSKRALQVAVLDLLTEQCHNIQEAKPSEISKSRLNFILSILKKSCIEYPVVIPYLMSLKVSLRDIKAALATKNNDLGTVLPDSSTFAQFLTFANVLDLQTSKDLLMEVLRRKQIKYINGHDFIRQEIAASVMASCIKMINYLRSKSHTGNQLISTLDILISTVEIQRKLTKTHSDIVKSIIQVSKQLISSTKSLTNMFELSQIYQRLTNLYFRTKEQDMRNGVSKQYQLSQLDYIRNFDSKELAQTPFTKVENLPTHTALTFGVNFDFEIENSVLDKSTHSPTSIKRTVPFHHVKKHLLASEKQSPAKQQSTEQVESAKELNLMNGRYNMLYHLGQGNVRKISDKSGFVFRFKSDTVFPSGEDIVVKTHEIKNIALFYMKDVAFPSITEQLIEEAVVDILTKKDRPLEFMRNPTNFGKVIDLLSIIILRDKREFKGESPLITYLKSIEGDKQKQHELINRILGIFTHFGYSNIWVNTYDDLAKLRLKVAQELLKDSKLPTNQSLLCLFLKYILNKSVEKEFSDFSGFSRFLKEFFENRPESNTSLTYKIPVDKTLLNLMLKCIDFENLHYASILFYANFENLRLYTEDIQEGFKALNLASKTRSYNEFLKLSKEYNDPEYLTPLRIFKENLKFFVKVQKEGYEFKRQEESAIAVDKIVNVLKAGNKDPTEEIDRVMQLYLNEVDKLKVNTVNRVKSMYMASKLRDLSIQNGQTISLLYDILNSGGIAKDKIFTEISKVEIFSIITQLLYQLLQFKHSHLLSSKYESYHLVDLKYLTEGLVYPTTKRFAFNMSYAMQKCEFEFDDVLQHALVSAKGFLSSDIGRQWSQQNLQINPAFYTQNRINNETKRKQLLQVIQKHIGRPSVKPIKIDVKQGTFFEDLKSQFDKLPNSSILSATGLDIEIEGKKATLEVLTQQLANILISKQILIKAGKYLIFNRFKFSEDSLDLVQMLGSLLAGCIYRGLRIDLPLHNSIVSLIKSSMTEFDDLVDVDFRTWESLKAVLSETDCKTMNLTFSYEFDSAKEPGKKERLELIDKGTSKKVNNLNRDEYCDLICCRILYGFSQSQLDRFQIGLFKILPKEFLSNTSTVTVLKTLYKQDNPDAERLQQLQHLRKFGLMYPELFIGRDRSFQNLKDFVNINWLLSLLSELPLDKLQKFAIQLGSSLQYLNLKIYTKTGQSQSLELLPQQKIVITHFSSKEKLQEELMKLIK